MTHYRAANNHIFFNLLNSITPGEERFEPARARFWSFAFVSLTIIFILISQALAGQLFKGGAQVFLLLANTLNLELMLQARGYGFLAFAALGCTVLTWSYFRGFSLMALIGIPLLVWLGTWTVPTFAFFGGALLLILLAYTRDWRWLPSGGCALAAILIAYWPVRAPLLLIAKTYSGFWGKEFGNWDAVSDVLSLYFLFRMGSWFTLLISVLLIVGLTWPRVRSAEDKASLCVGISVLITFILCLKMQTTAKRTVAFVVVPLGFVAATLFGNLLHQRSFRPFKTLVISVIVAVAFAFSLDLHKTFRAVPIEAWRETAQRIEARFGKGTEIVARFRPEWLQVYLSPEYPLTRQFDPAKFVAGKQIVVDSSFGLVQRDARPAAQSRFPLEDLPKGYLMETVSQQRGTTKIYFSPSVTALPAQPSSQPGRSP